MKHLKFYMIAGVFFVLILGSLSHFFYEWSDNNVFIGLFSPVNESTWEHMKLLFFPMLLYSVILVFRFREDCVCMKSAFFSGILLGTLSIPVIFYTYSGILGYNVPVLDIGTFAVSVFIAFYFSWRLTLTCRIQKYAWPVYAAVWLMAISFLVFSVFPPDIALYKSPV